MNEEHIVSAIITAGLLAQHKGDDLQPKDAVGFYVQCLAELIEVTRPHRTAED